MHYLYTLAVLLTSVAALGTAQAMYELEYVLPMPLTVLVEVLNFSQIMRSGMLRNHPSLIPLPPTLKCSRYQLLHPP